MIPPNHATVLNRTGSITVLDFSPIEFPQSYVITMKRSFYSSLHTYRGTIELETSIARPVTDIH